MRVKASMFGTARRQIPFQNANLVTKLHDLRRVLIAVALVALLRFARQLVELGPSAPWLCQPPRSPAVRLQARVVSSCVLGGTFIPQMGDTGVRTSRRRGPAPVAADLYPDSINGNGREFHCDEISSLSVPAIA